MVLLDHSGSGRGLEPLRFRGQLVVLGGEEVVQVAHGLEEDVQPRLALDAPEDAAVLEPGVGEDTVQPAEDVDEVLDRGGLVVAALARGRGRHEARGEDLGVRDHVGGPVEGVAAVVDGAAGFRGVVHGAQELPLRGAHLRARGGAAGRGVEEEADDEGVALRDEEAAELVEPEGAVDARGRRGEELGRLAGYGYGVAAGVVVVEGGEVLLELEGGVELGGDFVSVVYGKLEGR